MAVATPRSVLFAGREYFALGGGDCAPDDVVESLDGTVASSAEFTLPEGCEVVRHDDPNLRRSRRTSWPSSSGAAGRSRSATAPAASTPTGPG